MKIILATGIYPPDIGGPATYVRALVGELVKSGIEVVVVAYSRTSGLGHRTSENSESRSPNPEVRGGWEVVLVPKAGGPLLRWLRYTRALRTHAADADVVLAFSLVSCGVPLWWAHLKKPFDKAQGKPKLLLRLGGDFLWERYTDCGGGLGLRAWYESRFWLLVGSLFRWLVRFLLRTFDHIVFSTRLQEAIYERHYLHLPTHTVIENALPAPTPGPSPAVAGEGRTRHAPFRLLFIGRFVAFKNLSALLRAMTELPETSLTLVGEGPLQHFLEGNVRGLHIQDQVTFHPKVNQEGRGILFREHDLLVIPSVTEMSPNTALEARVAGVPVLLTEETGLSERLRQGMIIRKLRTPEQIRDALREAMAQYERIAEEAARMPTSRPWSAIAGEYLELFPKLASLSQ